MKKFLALLLVFSMVAESLPASSTDIWSERRASLRSKGQSNHLSHLAMVVPSDRMIQPKPITPFISADSNSLPLSTSFPKGTPAFRDSYDAKKVWSKASLERLKAALDAAPGRR